MISRGLLVWAGCCVVACVIHFLAYATVPDVNWQPAPAPQLIPLPQGVSGQERERIARLWMQDDDASGQQRETESAGDLAPDASGRAEIRLLSIVRATRTLVVFGLKGRENGPGTILRLATGDRAGPLVVRTVSDDQVLISLDGQDHVLQLFKGARVDMPVSRMQAILDNR